MPPLELVTRITASGMPASSAINDDTPTIRNVSMKPCSKRSNHITQYLYLLRPMAGAFAQFFGAEGRTCHRQQQLPERMPLNPFHATLQQTHAATECTEQCGKVRFGLGRSGELQAQYHRVFRGLRLRMQAALQLWRQGVLQRCEQGLADLMLRVAEDLPHRALFDDAPVFQHHDAVTGISDHN